MRRQHTQRLPMILSDSLLGVEIFDLMIRVDSKQNVGNISLNITKIKLLITVGPTAKVLIASVILLQIVRASDISRKKKQNFVGFSGANSRKNRPISRDFRGKKVKIRGKISRFCEIFGGEKSKFLEKSADFTGNFGGKLRQETISKKQLISLDFFGQISLKSINFASI